MSDEVEGTNEESDLGRRPLSWLQIGLVLAIIAVTIVVILALSGPSIGTVYSSAGVSL